MEKQGSDCFLIVGGKKYKCALSEMMIIERLYYKKGCVISKSDLANIGWPGRVVSSNSVPVAIANLRKIIREQHKSEVIITDKGGYFFALNSDVTLVNEELNDVLFTHEISNKIEVGNKNEQLEINVDRKFNKYTSAVKGFFRWRIILNFRKRYIVVALLLVANLLLLQKYNDVKVNSKPVFEIYKSSGDKQYIIVSGMGDYAKIKKILLEHEFKEYRSGLLSLNEIVEILNFDKLFSSVSIIKFLNFRDSGKKYILECLDFQKREHSSRVISNQDELLYTLDFKGCR
ncbi:hypothetical protein HGO26_00565 [Shewanella sp. S-1]|uniref:OmpR/PhoB-type domain-containing protein n=1 Tax=Shewanella oncorhynchi TaxID=2726434 RepID=A0ABX1KGQ9_9GAMM|nr:winged helix-turn-helix domain-containing protein [Shewanella oncorhynchi]NLQ21382.1 hypothetical protein [Shewanella oncorhynchi]